MTTLKGINYLDLIVDFFVDLNKQFPVNLTVSIQVKTTLTLEYGFVDLVQWHKVHHVNTSLFHP